MQAATNKAAQTWEVLSRRKKKKREAYLKATWIKCVRVGVVLRVVMKLVHVQNELPAFGNVIAYRHMHSNSHQLVG